MDGWKKTNMLFGYGCLDGWKKTNMLFGYLHEQIQLVYPMRLTCGLPPSSTSSVDDHEASNHHQAV